MNTSTRIGIALLSASLILLVLYGIDLMVMFTVASQNPTLQDIRGFLPLSASVRGMVFGGGAVAMSVLAYVVARKSKSKAIASLLIVNGVIIIGGILAFASSSIFSLATTIPMGAALIAIGVWKMAKDRNKTTLKMGEELG